MFMSKDENYKPQAFIGSIAKIPVIYSFAHSFAHATLAA
jgi:hypothetical protein